jgi:hypothetical protein
VANLPAVQNQSSDEPTEFHHRLAEQFAAGRRPAEIAKAVYPNDPVKRKALRRRIWATIHKDPQMAAASASRVQAEMIMGLPLAARALMRRAHKGRVDAIKLAFEATGFHNPRVQHQHSGEISVKVTMPRPPPVEDDPQVVDADVVD